VSREAEKSASSNNPDPTCLSSGVWGNPPDAQATNVQPPAWTSPLEGPHQAFDMRGIDRRFEFATASGLSTESPSRQSSLTGRSASIHPISSDNSPNTASPESMRQFDPDKFFEMNLSNNTMDVTMNMDQDDTVEFFTEMLGVNLNGPN
jgi:hypothetical protein